MKIPYRWTALLLSALLILLAGCNLPQKPTPPEATPTLETFPTLGSTPTTLIQTATTEPTQTTAPTQTAAPTDTSPAPSATPQPAATQTSAPPAPGVTLLQIKMLSTQSGWGVGTYQTDIQDILRTQDGGTTWKLVSPPETSRKGRGVVPYFLDGTHAWVIYAAQPGDAASLKATIWRTADSGATWQSASLEPGAMTAEFFAPGQIGFSDASNGWLLVHMGAGMMHDYVSLWKTGDGGASWKAVVDPTNATLPMSCYKNSLWFPALKKGFLAGNCGGVSAGLYFYASSDGGASWSLVTLPAPAGHAAIFSDPNTLNEGEDLVFLNAQNGYLLVRSTNISTNQALRWVYVTQDGGSTWKPYALPGAWGQIFYRTPSKAWYIAATARDAFKGSKIYHTSDAGASWKQLDTVNWLGPLQFVDDQTGWVIAKAGSASALVRSQNGGSSWDLLKTVLDH